MQRISINGIQVFPFQSKAQFLNYLEQEENNKILIAVNAEKIMKEDAGLRLLTETNIGYPDGEGAVMALRKKGAKAVKIAGSEFWLDLIRHFHKKKSFYLVGAKPEVIGNTVKKLSAQFPGIELKGYRDGYFNDEEFKELLEDVKTTGPDIVFVAMGSPRQEFIMEKLQAEHPAIYMGLGGSFDVYAGSAKRAPKIWIHLKLEWAYRLLKEPSRIFRQAVLVRFLFRLYTGRL